MNNFDEDSREKLEEDVRRYIIGHVTHEGEKIPMERIVCAIPWPDVFQLLDRQAAITDAEWDDELEQLHMGYKSLIAELQAKVDELTAENGDLEWRELHFKRKADDLQAERDYWKLHTDCWADKCKELERENAKLSSDELHHRVEIDTLRRNVDARRRIEAQMRALLDGATLVDEKGEVVA